MNKLSLLLVVGLALLSVIASSYAAPNEGYGGWTNATGTWACVDENQEGNTGSFVTPANCYDNDWDTWGYGSAGFVYMNYTVPANATFKGSFAHVKDAAHFNLSVWSATAALNCTGNDNKVMLRGTSPGGSSERWDCYNSTDWIVILSDGTNFALSESEVCWNETFIPATTATPSIFILTSGNATYTNSTTIRSTFNVTDTDTNPISVKAWLDNVLEYDAGSYTSGSVDYFDQTKGDGNHNLTVWASDGTNTNSSSLFFKTDTAAPSLAIQLPAATNNLAYSNGKTLRLNFTASDATGINACWYQLGNTTNNTLTSCQNTTFGIPAIGAYSAIVFANDSYNHTTNATVAFNVDFINEFRVDSITTPGTWFNFTGYFTNATDSVANNTAGVPPVLYILTSALPTGAVTFNASGSGFNNSLVSLGTVGNTTLLNYTQTVYPATLSITGVYDELTLSAICYDAYVSNLTASYNASSCGVLDIPYNSLPQGLVTITLSNASYVARNYFVTVNPSAYNSLTGWLLPSSSGSYITTFVYSAANPGGISGAIVSAERFLNGSWVTIEQKESDSQGKGFLFLYSWAQHRIRAEYGSLAALIPQYYPNPSFILPIQLNGTFAVTNVTWLFDTVAVNITPSSGYVSNVTRIAYLISSPAGDLSSYWLEVRKIRGANETVLYSNLVSGSPSGGEIWVDINVTSYLTPTKTADRFTATIGFSRLGYNPWNSTVTYIPLGTNTGYIPSFLDLFTSGGAGVSDPTAIYLIATLIALAAGGAIANAGQFGQGWTIGGSFVFIGVLALFAVYGLYSWSMLLLMALAAIGINLARSYL